VFEVGVVFLKGTVLQLVCGQWLCDLRVSEGGDPERGYQVLGVGLYEGPGSTPFGLWATAGGSKQVRSLTPWALDQGGVGAAGRTQGPHRPRFFPRGDQPSGFLPRCFFFLFFFFFSGYWLARRAARRGMELVRMLVRILGPSTDQARGFFARFQRGGPGRGQAPVSVVPLARVDQGAEPAVV